MSTILIQMADRQWTEEALHLACAMARSDHSEVMLLNLVPAQHYGWLGTSLGVAGMSSEESSYIWNCKAIAARYGIDLCVQPFQYMTLIGALVDSVDEFDARALFARVPQSAIPLWSRYERWDLRRQMTQRGCALYLLDDPARASIRVQPERPASAPKLA